MIVQACLNGARPADYHPALPLDAEAMAKEGVACIKGGAAELHLHVRDLSRRESLSAEAVDATLRAVRRECPGSLIGISTGAWIEADESRTLAMIESWRDLPDYASVNLSEPSAPDVMEKLRARGIGIEAGLSSVRDLERFLKLDRYGGVLRVLIEIEEHDLAEAMTNANVIAERLATAEMRRPILLHGLDSTVWPFVKLAAECRWSTRVGLEDGRELPSGAIASRNAELVAAAAEIIRATARG